MKAPEKIYLNPLLMEDGESIVRRCTFERLSGSQIEYTRTDAFIEKACEWIFNQANIYTKLTVESHHGSVYASFYSDKMIEDFKKAMTL